MRVLCVLSVVVVTCLWCAIPADAAGVHAGVGISVGGGGGGHCHGGVCHAPLVVVPTQPQPPPAVVVVSPPASQQSRVLVVPRSWPSQAIIVRPQPRCRPTPRVRIGFGVRIR